MKFVVIEGLDGSGKSTQVNLLQEYFKKESIPYKYLHFPRTDSPFFGELVAMFLRGEFGDLNDVNPYLVALIYAGDRKDADEMIRQWMKDDFLVLVDRYVYSNIAFQCAKVSDLKKREDLKNWILDLEYNYYSIKKPDLDIFLDVPFEFTKKKLTQERDGDDRDYLQGKKDIHEASLDFQKTVKEVYLDVLKTAQNFEQIMCSDENEMLPAEVISKRIIHTLKKHSIIR